MTITLRRLHGASRRTLATVTAGGLTALALATLPAPAAHATQTGQPVTDSATLSWGVSDLIRFNRNGLASLRGENGGDATCADANPTAPAVPPTARCSSINWANGDGTVDAVTGVTTLTYSGHLTSWASTGNQWVRLADPIVSFDATGAGSVTALVSFGTTTASTWVEPPAEKPTGAPTRVKVVDLLANPNATVGDGQFEDYPYATAFAKTLGGDGITTFSNLRGLWAPELVTHLHGPDGIADTQGGPSTDGFVYYTGFQNLVDASSRVRYPTPFTATARLAAAGTAATVTAVEGEGVDVAVSGTSFLQTDPGVYVSVRERAAGDAAYTGGSGTFLGTTWVSEDPADIAGGPQGASAAIAADGSLATTLRLPLASLTALDPAKLYSVVTRKAHGQGTIPANSSQITETDLDTAALIAAREDAKGASDVVLTAPASTYGQAATVTATVSAGAGAVTLTGAGAPINADIAAGVATFTLPANLAAGDHALTATYAGDANVTGDTGMATLTVAKASSTVTLSAPKGTYGKPVTVKATVSGGTGTVRLSGVGAVREAALVNGTATFTLPALTAARSYALTAAYAGDTNREASSTAGTLVVARTTSRWSLLKVTRVPTSKRVGKATVRIATATGVKVTARATLTLRKGAKVRRIAVNLRYGAATVTLPRLAKGAWRATVSWAGNANVARPANKAITLRVVR